MIAQISPQANIDRRSGKIAALGLVVERVWSSATGFHT
jgi:hypothetical protein